MYLPATVTDRLDKVEESLPPFPKAVFKFNRAATERVVDGYGRAATAVIDFASDTTKSVADVAQRYSGEFGSVADERFRSMAADAQKFASDAQRFATDSFDVASEGFKKVAGQFGASVAEARDEMTESVDEAAERIQRSEIRAEKRSLSGKTKAELYEMAQALEIEGRATMSKDELVKAIAPLV